MADTFHPLPLTVEALASKPELYDALGGVIVIASIPVDETLLLFWNTEVIYINDSGAFRIN